MSLYRKTASTVILLAIGALTLTLAGCSSTALPPGKSVLDVAQAKNSAPLATQTPQTNFPGHPTGFDWAQQTLKASGQGATPEGMPAAQASLTASNAARIHALTNLKSQIKRLPVGSDQTVGSIMETYITIRHAIDQEIATASVSGQRPLPTGGLEIQVTLPLQNVATILQRYQITTDQELPSADEQVAGVPDMI